MARFEIVELTPNGPQKVEIEGIYTAGAEAAKRAKALTTLTGRTFQPRPLKDDKDWRERERKRFETGEYEALPWETNPDHFAHRSKKHVENVAFTPSAEFGEQDRQVTVHINTYLARHHPELTVDERRSRVWEYTGYDPMENLRFCESEEEIVDVYENGPNSCMSYNRDTFCEQQHPVKAYWGHDLNVAYIKENGRITARTVVCPERKIYARIYGDEEKLETALKTQGYRKGVFEADWIGVKLATKFVEGTRYDDDDEPYDIEGFLAPYVDFASFATLHENERLLTISRTGPYALNNTGGIAEECGWGGTCQVCKTYKFGSHQAYQCDDARTVRACQDCRAEKYGYCCSSGTVLWEGAPHTLLPDGRRVATGYGKICSITGQLVPHIDCTTRNGRFVTPAELEHHLSKAA